MGILSRFQADFKSQTQISLSDLFSKLLFFKKHWKLADNLIHILE